MDMPTTISLPPADLHNLQELDNNMRIMSSSAGGRDALAKYIMNEDYIRKLIPLVEMAEDLESLGDLHHLCNIMKTILLLNDTGIIEHAVSDDCVLGVVGALEYDPDFPSHKANHRQWLNNQGRYKEVVRIQDDIIRRKIHQTYRLQYLKDVVLARILDDPTFSVLNSLIFFNQVDIVQHLQANVGFLNDLFGIFIDPGEELLRKKEAVLFIQQCCAIAKNLQPPARLTLYNNFLSHGLLQVINFGLRNLDVAARVGATDILVSMIDHDPQMIRQTMYRQLQEKQPPLTDTLIDLLLVEVDLGIKSQVSDALKVLLDPTPSGQAQENFAAKANGEFANRPRPQQQPIDAQQELFLNYFYEQSAPRLFKPLLDLEGRTDHNFSPVEDGIFSYLNDILCFYVRQHHHRSKYFVLTQNLVLRFAQLLDCQQKHLQLGKHISHSHQPPKPEANRLPVAIRFFRQLVFLQDDFYSRHIAEKRVLGPILDVLIKTLPRDNLLCSACLDLFELIKKENIKELTMHLVDNYREKMERLDYLETFQSLLLRGDVPQGYGNSMDSYFNEGEEDTSNGRPSNVGVRGHMEHLAMDPEEEAYWNTSDDEDDADVKKAGQATVSNGGELVSKPLVDYASDEDADENGDLEMPPAETQPGADHAEDDSLSETSTTSVSPPERLSEKRRREEDEEDELGKLMQNKRRHSGSSGISANMSAFRKKKGGAAGGGSPGSGGGGPKKISISISPALKSSTTGQQEEEAS